MLKKNCFQWSEEARASFENLKACMSEPPVLAIPDFSKIFTIECYALGIRVEAVLMQEGKPLAFSQAKEILTFYLPMKKSSLVIAIKKWRSYLLSWRFMIPTDQQNLKYSLERRVVTPMQQKWLIKLMGNDFVVEYKSGLDNKAADALSHHDEPSSRLGLL